MASKAVLEIQAIINAHDGDSNKTVKHLLSEKVPHLSYSKIASYEYCPQKFYLEYVRNLRVKPVPVYFIKGRIFHEAAARFYSREGIRAQHAKLDQRSLRRITTEADRTHLRHAIAMLNENRWGQEWEVVGTELPFVMELHPQMPPLVGVIDLVLRRGSQYVIVDHKTGMKFNELDAMQLAFYREHVRVNLGGRRVNCYYDQYRWVADRTRLRKPGFLRLQVPVTSRDFARATARARRAFKGMREISVSLAFPFSQKCYACQFKERCHG